MSDHMREQFEDTMSSQGEWPQAIEKDLAGGYKLAITATAWETWQSAWEAGQEMMKSRIKELEAINLGLTKTLLEEESEKVKLVGALERLVGDVERATHVEFGGTPWLKEKMAEIDYARIALAAYRKQGGEA